MKKLCLSNIPLSAGAGVGYSSLKKTLCLLLLSLLTMLAFAEETSLPELPAESPMPISLSKADIDNYLKTGVSEYLNNNFKEALENFLSAENAGVKNPDLYYNIGNAYFRLGDNAHSIVYYKRALRLNSSHKPAQHNLEFVLSIIPDRQTDTEENLLAQFVMKTINFFSINALLVWCLIILALIIVIIHIQWYFTQLDRTILRFVNFVLVFILLFFAGITCTRIHLLNTKEAVITENTIYAYSGPSENFVRLFPMRTGTVIKIQKEENDWTHIKTLSGHSGWIKNDTYTRVN